MELKRRVLEELHRMVDGKIKDAQVAVTASAESRDNETKSSAGDKHETGRAMVQIEQERNGIQLTKALDLKTALGQIKSEKLLDKALLGSLITTANGIYFLSIGLGKVVVDDTVVFAVSINSPVGKLLFNKTVGEHFSLAGKSVVIDAIC